MLRFIRPISFLAICLIVPTVYAVEPTPEQVMEKFVGAWRNEDVQTTADGRKKASHELITKELKGRYLIGRDTNLQNGVKTLWLMTYDPQQKDDISTFFNSHDLHGVQWRGSWDEASQTHTSHSSDAPAGWTSEAASRFVTKDRVEATAWMKDAQGKSILDMTFTKTRQSDDVREKWLAAWQADSEKVPELSPELKLLDRLAGTWDVTAESKKAEWTPADISIKSKVVRSWVLNRTYLQDISTGADGTESISLNTYDPKRSEYRAWWFSSEGYTSKSTGQADQTGNAILWKSTLPTGQTSNGSVTILDADNQVWKFIITDAADKVYFDCVWHCVRAK
jgi:Protein of unknown function (DUF1579)